MKIQTKLRVLLLSEKTDNIFPVYAWIVGGSNVKYGLSSVILKSFISSEDLRSMNLFKMLEKVGLSLDWMFQHWCIT